MHPFKIYLAYLRDNPEKLWFKRKLYGWGWTPALWQGWATLGVFLIFIVWAGVGLPAVPTQKELVWFFVKIIGISTVLIFICYKTGEKPKWMWGEERMGESYTGAGKQEHASFRAILPKICMQDTSADPEHWTYENPLWGHCAVVSLLAQEKFGGELIRQSFETVPELTYLRSHYSNRLPNGEDVDFTAEQFHGTFPEGLEKEIRSRERVLGHPDTQKRYAILKERFLASNTWHEETGKTKHKTMKFTSRLVSPICSGEKTSTWRLFDDKDLRVGDVVDFIEKESGVVFRRARICAVREKALQDVVETDFEGHETYESKEEMYEDFRKYYGDKVTPESVVKIITFELLKEIV